ncbi:MAG: pyridoxal phosphate-dependent aminotransferase [Clostridia bacterium]|nr:pyridoxal phosphate-dependent aminotransferase [Clostridia bacterium]
MKYGFDRLTDRRGTMSYKWDVAEGELPMWVADMDFETAPAVRAAIMKKAEEGIFGYSVTPCEFFEAVSGYFERRHGFRIPTEWMVYSNGVVAAISSIVRRLTHPNECVLIQAPVYNVFYNSILNNGRRVLSSDLVYSGGEYSIDFSDLEEKLSRDETTLFILCNPHNPVGKLWSREELARIAELCYKHGVTVLSDEIHCDFVKPGLSYTPFAAVSELAADISVSCVSVSKTFNAAGLQSAAVIVKDKQLRYRVFRGLNNDEVGEPNVFAMSANIAAFRDSDEWVEELVSYIFENKRLACEYINGRIPGLRANLSDATYLLWIDISSLSDDSVDFCKRLRAATGLYLSDGEEYGECGRSFVRMNLATQRERVLDGLARLERFCNTGGE